MGVTAGGGRATAAAELRTAGKAHSSPGRRGMNAAGRWLDCTFQLLGLALIANHFVKMNEEDAASNRVLTGKKRKKEKEKVMYSFYFLPSFFLRTLC